MLRFLPVNLNDRILVISPRGDFLGDISEDATGFLFTPCGDPLNAFTGGMLREIANKLSEMNGSLFRDEALSEEAHS